MKFTRQSTHALVSGVACTMLAGVANASEASNVSIDRIARSVQIDAGFLSRSDADNSPFTEEWHGHVEARHPRGGMAHADQFFVVNADRIEGEMRVMSSMSRRLSEASSSLEVAFTVSRSDFSRPDATWGWSGDGALEALYGGAEAFGERPACRMSLHGLLAYEQLASTTNFPLKSKGVPSFGGFGRSRGSMGFTLTRDGRRYEHELLAPSRQRGMKEFDLVLELPPGEYVLNIECGLLESPFRPGGPVLGEVTVNLGVAFEPLQPGSAEPRGTNVSGFWHQSNGTFVDMWMYRLNSDPMTDPETLEFQEERWYQHSMPFANEYMDGGAVYAIDPTYQHGFLFTRTEKEDASNDVHATTSDVDITLSIKLDETTEVGIAALCAFKNESDGADANHGNCEIRVYSLEESATVWEDSWQPDADKAASSRQFVESQDWITLDPGVYRIRIKSESTSNDVRGEDTGNENGFWYALAFETP